MSATRHIVSNMDHIDVPLSDDLRAHVDARVGTGDFASPGAYIETLIDRDRRNIAALRGAIERGDASGVSLRSFDEIVESAFQRHSASGV